MINAIMREQLMRKNEDTFSMLIGTVSAYNDLWYNTVLTNFRNNLQDDDKKKVVDSLFQYINDAKEYERKK